MEAPTTSYAATGVGVLYLFVSMLRFRRFPRRENGRDRAADREDRWYARRD